MVRTALYFLIAAILTVSSSFAQETAPPKVEEKKGEKPKRDPVVDVFTRIDQGEGGVDALVIYGHPLYFVYKGVLADATKKYDMDRFHVFLVTINSQKKEDLSAFKVESSIFLRTEEGLEYPAVPQWIPLAETTGKRTGIIRFFKIDANKNQILKDNAKSFEIIIRNLANVPERTFKWDLPIEF